MASKQHKADLTHLCTQLSTSLQRSSIFLILLSLASTSLLPSWNAAKKESQTGSYINSRLMLSYEVADLKSNPHWNYYKSMGTIHEDMSITEIENLNLHWPPDEVVKDRKKLESKNKGSDINVPEKTATGPPAAPSGLTVVQIRASPVNSLKARLHNLNNFNLLSSARSEDAYHDHNIYRWERLMDSKILSNKARSGKYEIGFQRAKLQESNKRWETDDLNTFLTINEINTISDFLKPVLQAEISVTTADHPPETAGSIEILPTKLPSDLKTATLLIFVLILLQLLYFECLIAKAITISSFQKKIFYFSLITSSALRIILFYSLLIFPAVFSVIAAINILSIPLLLTSSTIVVITIFCVKRLYSNGLRV